MSNEPYTFGAAGGNTQIDAQGNIIQCQVHTLRASTGPIGAFFYCDTCQTRYQDGLDNNVPQLSTDAQILTYLQTQQSNAGEGNT